MQYNLYTVNVTNGLATVEGNSTSFVTKNVASGDAFKVIGDSVIYTVASVTNETLLTLTSAYQGTTGTLKPYAITRDYTPNLGLAEVGLGDQDWATIFTQRTLRPLDTIIANILSALGITKDSVRLDKISLNNLTVAPATPTTGGVLYIQGGALSYKGANGVVTTLAGP
jgi:hypothetical protein